jgi:hypothetical protein
MALRKIVDHGVGLAGKEQIGPAFPSTIAAMGREWPSSTPSRPSITVRSEERAFQSFSSSFCSVLMERSFSMAGFGSRKQPF